MDGQTLSELYKIEHVKCQVSAVTDWWTLYGTGAILAVVLGRPTDWPARPVSAACEDAVGVYAAAAMKCSTSGGARYYQLKGSTWQAYQI